MSTITTRAGKGSALTHNQLDANFKKAAQAKVGAYTVAESDNRDTIECSGTFTVTLPDVATVVAAADTGDFEVTIKNTGSGTITVSCTTGTDTIDGSTSDITLTQNQSKTLKTNQAGSGYNVIAYVDTVYEDSFATGAFTTASLASTATDTRSIAHGLGTDDIDFNCKMTSSSDSGETASCCMVDAGGYVKFSRAPNAFANMSVPSTPSAGNIAFKTLNSFGTSQTVTVHWWARKR